MADAKVAFDSYEAAIKDVKAAMAQMARLEARSKKTVAKLSRDFEKAKQVADKLAGFNTTHLVNGRFVSCPVSKPYSFVDLGRRLLRRPVPQGDRHHEPHGQQGPRHRRRGHQPAVDQLTGRHQPVPAGCRRERVLRPLGTRR